MDYTAHYDSPLGGITIASNGEALVGLYFDKSNSLPPCSATSDPSNSSSTILDLTKHWLDMYFSGKVPDFTPPILMRASGFCRRVWEIMLQIPYGHTMTYGEIAAIIAKERQMKSMSAQAVGGAVGHNCIPIIIPCHRVIGANGTLTGYSAGLDKKIQLLKIEGIL